MATSSSQQHLNYLVIHCTATAAGKHFTKDDIIRWHTLPTYKGGRGWNRPGYSDIVYLDGALVNIIPYNSDDFVDLWEISNGVEGINGRSRHVVYVGGMDRENKHPEDTRTREQKQTLEVYVKFTLLQHPGIQILGHYQAPSAKGKVCPSFDVPVWLSEIGVPEKHIYHS